MIITGRRPKARMIYTIEERRVSNIVAIEKKAGLINPMKRDNNTMIIKAMNSFELIIFLTIDLSYS
jgi:hypothetical protein